MLFEFKPTSAFSENFDNFDIGDMNFLMNSGSVVILILLIIVFGVFWTLVHAMARLCYRFKSCRRAGIYSSGKLGFFDSVIQVFTEGYIEVTLPALLGATALYSNVDVSSQKEWWLTESD